MAKKAKTRSINAKKAKNKNINISKKWKKWYIKTDSKLLICLRSTLQSGEPKRRWYRIHPKDQRYPKSTVAFFLAALNTPCRWSKQSAKKKLSIAKVVTFEATPKLWGMGDWRIRCKKRTRWTRSKAFPVGIYVMAHYYFSIHFCTSSSSCCCIIL